MKMTNETKEDMDKIKRLEDKYGLLVFGMGLTHLVDAGHSNMGNKAYVEASVKIFCEQPDDNKAHAFSLSLQRKVLNCAAELAEFSIWALFRYIKEYMHIGN